MNQGVRRARLWRRALVDVPVSDRAQDWGQIHLIDGDQDGLAGAGDAVADPDRYRVAARPLGLRGLPDEQTLGADAGSRRRARIQAEAQGLTADAVIGGHGGETEQGALVDPLVADRRQHWRHVQRIDGHQRNQDGAD
jgi:hypothetical protein